MVVGRVKHQASISCCSSQWQLAMDGGEMKLSNWYDEGEVRIELNVRGACTRAAIKNDEAGPRSQQRQQHIQFLMNDNVKELSSLKR